MRPRHVQIGWLLPVRWMRLPALLVRRLPGYGPTFPFSADELERILEENNQSQSHLPTTLVPALPSEQAQAAHPSPSCEESSHSCLSGSSPGPASPRLATEVYHVGPGPPGDTEAVQEASAPGVS